MTIEELREKGRAVGMMNPLTTSYKTCPKHPASELLFIETQDGAEAVICYEAWVSDECRYIAQPQQPSLFNA